MSDEKKTNYYEVLLKKEWSYTTGAVLLAVFASILLIATGSAWGVTGPFSIWGGKVLEMIGMNVDEWAIYKGALGKYNFWTSQPSLTNLGIVLGALLAVLLATSFKIKKIKSKKQVSAAVLGGLFMGIGARLALGCNIGSFFSGIPAFSFHGWIFALFIFLGAMVGSYMLTKWFM